MCNEPIVLPLQPPLNRPPPNRQVEILLPEFWDPISGPIFPNKGDQERFWRMTRRFVEALQQATGGGKVKAVSGRFACHGRRVHCPFGES